MDKQLTFYEQAWWQFAAEFLKQERQMNIGKTFDGLIDMSVNDPIYHLTVGGSKVERSYTKDIHEATTMANVMSRSLDRMYSPMTVIIVDEEDNIISFHTDGNRYTKAED